MDRRRFLTAVTLGASALLGALLAVPVLGQLLSPLRRVAAAPSAWRGVGSLADFELGRPTRVAFPVVVRDGWVTKRTRQAAWVVRTGERSVRALSTVCPHLGCSVEWESRARRFGCPCHDSRFDPEGGYRQGPARRGMDELPSRIVGESVELRWVEFVPGIAKQRPVGGTVA